MFTNVTAELKSHGARKFMCGSFEIKEAKLLKGETRFGLDIMK